MFTIIDGGFHFAVKGLFTMDLSWLFMFCLMLATNFIILTYKCIGKVKTMRT